MPNVSNFEPPPAVCSWLQAKDRRSKSTNKSDQHSWSRNVFSGGSSASAELADPDTTEAAEAELRQSQTVNKKIKF